MKKIYYFLIFSLIFILNIFLFAQTADAVLGNYTPLVNIPGVTNQNITNQGLGPYLVGIYKTTISLSIIVGVFMFIYHAFMYTTSEASVGNKSKARAGMWDVVYGIVLILSAYLILQTINPQLVRFELNINPPAPPVFNSIDINSIMNAKLGFDANNLTEQTICDNKIASMAFVLKNPGIYIEQGVLCQPTLLGSTLAYDVVQSAVDFWNYWIGDNKIDIPNSSNMFIVSKYSFYNSDFMKLTDCTNMTIVNPIYSCFRIKDPKILLTYSFTAKLKHYNGDLIKDNNSKVFTFGTAYFDNTATGISQCNTAKQALENSINTPSWKNHVPAQLFNVSTLSGASPGYFVGQDGNKYQYELDYNKTICRPASVGDAPDPTSK